MLLTEMPKLAVNLSHTCMRVSTHPGFLHHQLDLISCNILTDERQEVGPVTAPPALQARPFTQQRGPKFGLH